MKTYALLAALLFSAVQAQAQARAIPVEGDVDCGGAAVRAPPVVAEPVAGLFLISPPFGTADVPLNAELIVDGSFFEITGEDPTMKIVLQANGRPVDISLDGDRVIVEGGLLANTDYRFFSDFIDGSCDGCFGESTFTTGADIDQTPPAVDGDLLLVAGDACFGGGSAILRLTDIEDLTFIRGAAASVRQPALTQPASQVFSDVMGQSINGIDVRIDDRMRFAFVATDLAGNKSAPLILRSRALDPQDLTEDVDVMPAPSCALNNEIALSIDTTSSGGVVEVEVPFELPPLVAVNGDQRVSLVPALDLGFRHQLEPSVPLDAGTWTLETEPCALCACVECADVEVLGTLAVLPTNNTPPALPVIISAREDLSPIDEDGCANADRGLELLLEPGRHPDFAAEDLRYQVDVRVDGLPPIRLAERGKPSEGDDGDLVKLDTLRDFGELLSQPDVILEVTAIAPNGQRSEAAIIRPPRTVGCASSAVSSTSAPLSVVALGAAFIFFRRRRSS